jgi:lysophospholipase L1-like esterase
MSSVTYNLIKVNEEVIIFMKIIFLGDSLTGGIPANEGKTWVDLVAKMNPENECINKGIMGDTTSGMLSRFYRDTIEESGRCVVIMGGLNDLFLGVDVGSVKSNLMALAHQAYFYAVKPIVCMPPIPIPQMIKNEWLGFADYQKVANECRGLRRWLPSFSKTFGIFMVDFEEGFEILGKEDKETYFVDGIHPNEKGNELMANWISKSLA